MNGEGSGGIPYFSFEEDRLSSTFDVNDPSAFRDLLREILDWRLAEYLDRANPTEARADVICRLARNTGGSPIIFFPRPATELGLRLGPNKVSIDGEPFEAIIAKIAINVVRRNDQDATNRLPEILRRWFGEDVGLSGRGERIRLKRGEDGFELEPLRVGISKELTVWSSYQREEIPKCFGLTFNPAIWNAGFIIQEPHIFLLVTLEKKGMLEDHQYVDHFISQNEFAWQSQNRTTQASKHGQMMHNHRSLGNEIHLFVRPTKKTGSRPTPFIYCGRVDFESWQGDAPVSIVWRLREEVPSAIRAILGVPGDGLIRS